MAKLTSPDIMKRQNMKKILRIIYSEESIYRKRIAQMTNLSSQTVTNIVKELMENGIVKEERIKKGSAGRNPMALTINYRDFYVIGVEITVNTITAVLTDLKGELIKRNDCNIVESEDALKLLKDMLADLWIMVKDPCRIKGLSISIEGVVNDKTGMVTQISTKAWKGIKLKEELEYLGIPVLLKNDVNVLADIENFRVGMKENFIVVKVDQGIGSSIVIDGHVMHSANNVAGEFGHITVDTSENRKICGCGKSGCLTTIASIGAIEDDFNIDYEEIKSRIANEDKTILERLKKICYSIALPLANAITLLDLDKVILTGRLVIDHKDLILTYLQDMIKVNLSDWLSYKGLYVMQTNDVAVDCTKLLVEDCFENERDFLI